MSLIPERIWKMKRKPLDELLKDVSLEENPLSGVVSATYKDLEFESKAPRASDGKKELVYYDAAKKRVESIGKRLPFFCEVFSLLRAGLEGKLDSNPELKAVANDMVDSYGEWFNQGVEVGAVSGATRPLTVYNAPLLVWNGSQSKYVWQHNSISHSGKQTYHLSKDIPLARWVDLNKFPDAFVVDTYGCLFKDLPPVMQTGDRKAQIYLPPEGVVRPAGRGYFNYYDIGCGCGSGASRWVRPVAPKVP